MGHHYTGTGYLPADVTSSGPSICVRFMSDDETTAGGFSFTVNEVASKKTLGKTTGISKKSPGNSKKTPGSSKKTLENLKEIFELLMKNNKNTPGFKLPSPGDILE